MRRSTPPFTAVVGGSGGAGSVVAPIEQYETDHTDQNPALRQLKRKHSEERFLPYQYQEQGHSIHKVRKDNHLQLHDVDHFHGFGQAFHGPTPEFQVIAASDGNNNQNHIQQEQQPLSYIYEVSSGSSVPVIPVPQSQMISQDISTSSNGIVLTDISSSTWTSTQELLDLDRKPTLTIPTDSHNAFPIASADHHHHHQQHHIQDQHTPLHHHHQQQQHHHHQHHQGNFHGHQSVHPQYGNNHTKTQELTIVTSSCSRTPTAGATTTGPGCVRRVPPAATPETPEDIEDKNLSWLFNFKLEDLPHLSPEAKRKQAPKNVGPTGGGTVGCSVHAAISQLESEPGLDQTTAIEEDDMNVAENVTIENSTAAAAAKVTKKPPFTYTELIEYALEDKGELTVSGIYQWISDHFPFYKSNDDRWKNSVRHNLSINPHFRKGNKAPQGAGHLWTISSRDSEANFLAWEHKRQRLELFFKMEAANAKTQREAPGSPNQDEIAAATASLAQYEPHSPGHGSTSESIDYRLSQPGSSGQHLQPSLGQQQQQPMYASIPNNQFEVVQGEELKRSAGEILNGIRRNVEVQIVHPINSNNFQAYALLDSDYYLADYLNPVSKEEIVQECGLRSAAGHRSDAAPPTDYYITTIDPIELGINMSSSQDEDQILFEDDFNLNYFGNNIMT
ncbi:forkhead box protein P1-B-like [Ochlerotatus camptorhynchus]|uniref:forkhead box protein P1-B-like n=1 Tax=Ochlerotatus camptorhynchus TaxID=644619 RepID=UPI0031D82974